MTKVAPQAKSTSAVRAHKKQRGIFFTPRPIALSLARALVQQLDDRSGGMTPTVLDPFVGSGVLLSAFAEALAERYPKSERERAFHLALARSCGVDVVPENLQAAQVALAAEDDQLADRLARQLQSFDALCADMGPGGPFHTFEPTAEGGFDVVIANPPWEKVRVNDREFFSAIEPGFSRLARATRDTRKGELLEVPEVRTAYLAYRERVAHLKAHARSEYATVGSGGDLDMYKLAVERCMTLLRPGGLAGLIVPHGLLGDWGARALREWLLQNHTWVELRRLETGRELFPEIHANLGVLIAIFRSGRVESIRSSPALESPIKSPEVIQVSAPIRSQADLQSPRFSALPRQLVANATPHAMVPLVSSDADIAFLQACQVFASAADHPGFHPRREIDMTNDRRHFREAGAGVPLLEGKHAAPFSISLAGRRWDVPVAVARYADQHRVAWRAVADRAMRRRIFGAWVPPGVALGNSLIFTLVGADESWDQLLWVLAWLNSRPVEAQLRLLCANNNINIFHIRACRIPKLDEVPEAESLLSLTASLLRDRSALPAGVRDRAQAGLGQPIGARLEALDEAWRKAFQIEPTLWRAAVLDRTHPVRLT